MKYYVVDAFADAVFKGNPAGVCLLDTWIDDCLMQSIAFENNLAETAFLVRQDGYWDLKWFTPEMEMDLCGHATLASAFVLANFVEKTLSRFEFHTKSGPLNVVKDGSLYTMDFPSRKPALHPVPAGLEEVLGAKVLETHLSRDLLVLLENEQAVADLKPDLYKLGKIEGAFAVIVTAKGETCDFVSRFFAPGAGVPEDPVTGSSHCTLIPFWSERLGKTDLLARQLSRRGGTLYCKDKGTRVEIGGRAVCYLEGNIHI
jgi:phenazine biosynthesis protein PhzF family